MDESSKNSSPGQGNIPNPDRIQMAQVNDRPLEIPPPPSKSTPKAQAVPMSQYNPDRRSFLKKALGFVGLGALVTGGGAVAAGAVIEAGARKLGDLEKKDFQVGNPPPPTIKKP